MHAKIADLEKQSAKVGLVINTRKTKEMRINAKNKSLLYIGNEASFELSISPILAVTYQQMEAY
jgi:hypothetical protein